MVSELQESLDRYREQTYLYFRQIAALERPFLLYSDLQTELDAFCASDAGKGFDDSYLAFILRRTREAAFSSPIVFLAVRMDIADWQYLMVDIDHITVRAATVSDLHEFRERILDPEMGPDDWCTKFDLDPFNHEFPKLRESSSIGNGVEFLNRNLSGRLFGGEGRGFQRLLGFLKVHHIEGQQLMLNRRIESIDQLRSALRNARRFVRGQPADVEWADMELKLQDLGFEPGWGKTKAHIQRSMDLLADILEAPAPKVLEEFLGRLPMVFKIAIISPHGFFGQANVLGMPDTGGQVVYILDQVRALEKQMRESIAELGLEIEPKIVVLTRLIPEAEGTTCNQRIERIAGTEHAIILRVPFRTQDGQPVPHWISRFHVWPYLEEYAIESEKEMLAELGGRPDFVIGNYSDGNLVASILANRLGVTQCTIAHALEKTKYLFSGLYWRDHEEQYHFSTQFTADLIAMNYADFIITSTYQEIAGTPESVGQYESYQSFTLPGLYRVENGLDVHDPKFNIVSPGADADIFFPYNIKAKRFKGLKKDIRTLIYGKPNQDARGHLADRKKPLIFLMSRLDRIKNAPGFLEWYAKSEELQEYANVFLVGGRVNPDESSDEDERQQIEALHALMDEYQLDDKVRWVIQQTDKHFVGELYRSIADTRGIFVQPALFEAFGLTIIEAMSCGLPVFATCYGGPLEIIEDGISGFHIDPNHGDEAVQRMAEFFRWCKEDVKYWNSFSQNALERIRERYTWERYAKRLMVLTRIYGFWKYISNIERQETRAYLDMFYGLMLRPLISNIHRE